MNFDVCILPRTFEILRNGFRPTDKGHHWLTHYYHLSILAWMSACPSMHLATPTSWTVWISSNRRRRTLRESRKSGMRSLPRRKSLKLLSKNSLSNKRSADRIKCKLQNGETILTLFSNLSKQIKSLEAKAAYEGKAKSLGDENKALKVGIQSLLPRKF